jgi:hypothetical protein
VNLTAAIKYLLEHQLTLIESREQLFEAKRPGKRDRGLLLAATAAGTPGGQIFSFFARFLMKARSKPSHLSANTPGIQSPEASARLIFKKQGRARKT